jgi:hypothetical protein
MNPFFIRAESSSRKFLDVFAQEAMWNSQSIWIFEFHFFFTIDGTKLGRLASPVGCQISQSDKRDGPPGRRALQRPSTLYTVTWALGKK